MKKLIVTAACITAAIGGFAQGTIGFQNSVTTEFYFGISSGSTLIGSTAVPANTTTVDVGLFYSATPFNTIAAGTLGGVVTFSTAIGRIAGSAIFTPAGINAGDSDYYQVFAWDAAFGDTLAGLEACVAADGLFGASSAGPANATYGAIGDSILLTANPLIAPGPPVFGTSGNSFRKTVILGAPEPATIAISGLGAAALLMFRRRK